MLAVDQNRVDHYLNIRSKIKIDPQFKTIDDYVKLGWTVFLSRNTQTDFFDNVVLSDFKFSNPRIVSAANRYGDLIMVGVRHGCNVMCSLTGLFGGLKNLHEYSLLELHDNWLGHEQGFVDQYGNFYNRKEAKIIAKNNGQIIHDIGYKGDELFTEHLY